VLFYQCKVHTSPRVTRTAGVPHARCRVWN
jgi:hypothetical protein